MPGDQWIDDLARLYGPIEAGVWLSTRNTLLDGKTPNDVIAEGREHDVIALVDQLASGAFL